MNANPITAQDWFKVGDDDLAYARLGLKEDDFYGLIAFHAQQAAEKYLKGFLLLRGKNPKRTHDLVQLLEECQKIDTEFFSIRKYADILMPYSVEARYPVFYPIIKKEFAEEAVAVAEEIVNFIKEKLEGNSKKDVLDSCAGIIDLKTKRKTNFAMEKDDKYLCLNNNYFVETFHETSRPRDFS